MGCLGFTIKFKDEDPAWGLCYSRGFGQSRLFSVQNGADVVGGEEQRRGGRPGTWGLGVLQCQIGSLRCHVRPHREEKRNVDSVREGAMSGDGLSRIDTTAGMLTALSEKQQEDENGRRREGGENCGKRHFRAQPYYSKGIVPL